MVTASLLSARADKKNAQSQTEDFSYSVEQFADLEILRYRVPGFESLSLRQKELVYYLTEAALQGRDILFDQNGKWNLPIRRTIEAVYTQYKGDKESSDFKALEKYLKRMDKNTRLFSDLLNCAFRSGSRAREDCIFKHQTSPEFFASFASALILDKEKKLNKNL